MRHLRSTFAFAALTLAGALALATAAPGQPAPGPAPAPSPGPSPAPAPDAATDPGQALLQAKCTMCHDTGPILAEHHTAADWKDLVNQMVGRGAAVSDTEADQIVAYLAKTQPAAAPAPAS
jgi:cytochrome c5